MNLKTLFLQIAAEHAQKVDVSYFSIPPFHQLPYSHSQFSILNDFVLKINEIQIKLNRFFFSCVSDEIYDTIRGNDSCYAFSITIQGSNRIDKSVHEFETLFTGGILEITKENFEDIVEISKFLKISSLRDSCLQFHLQYNQIESLVTKFSNADLNYILLVKAECDSIYFQENENFSSVLNRAVSRISNCHEKHYFPSQYDQLFSNVPLLKEICTIIFQERKKLNPNDQQMEEMNQLTSLMSTFSNGNVSRITDKIVHLLEQHHINKIKIADQEQQINKLQKENEELSPINKLSTESKIHIPISGHDGIIAYLKEKHYDSIIITASPSWTEPNAVLMYDDSFWNSKNQDESWICIGFRGLSINPTGYLLRSWNSNYGSIQNWKLEASQDSSDWVKLDEQLNTEALNGKCLEFQYPCETRNSFSYFKFTQIGKNASIESKFFYEFHLTFIEFSGTICYH